MTPWNAANPFAHLAGAFAVMSTLVTNFVHEWISNNIPNTAGCDAISVTELTEKLFADAKAVGITSSEVEEDTGRIYAMILDAIVQQDADWTY